MLVLVLVLVVVVVVVGVVVVVVVTISMNKYEISFHNDLRTKCIWQIIVKTSFVEEVVVT